jgi:hypothetical protein
LLLLLSPIAVAVDHFFAVAVNHCHCRDVALPSAIAVAITIAVAVGHCHLCHRRPLQLPSPLAIIVTIAVGHFQELLPWHRENCI